MSTSNINVNNNNNNYLSLNIVPSFDCEVSSINKFPEEIREICLSYLNDKDIRNLSFLNKSWKHSTTQIQQKQSKRTDHLSRLSSEIFCEICNFLPMKHMGSLSSVSKEIRYIVQGSLRGRLLEYFSSEQVKQLFPLKQNTKQQFIALFSKKKKRIHYCGFNPDLIDLYKKTDSPNNMKYQCFLRSEGYLKTDLKKLNENLQLSNTDKLSSYFNLFELCLSENRIDIADKVMLEIKTLYPKKKYYDADLEENIYHIIKKHVKKLMKSATPYNINSRFKDSVKSIDCFLSRTIKIYAQIHLFKLINQAQYPYYAKKLAEHMTSNHEKSIYLSSALFSIAKSSLKKQNLSFAPTQMYKIAFNSLNNIPCHPPSGGLTRVFYRDTLVVILNTLIMDQRINEALMIISQRSRQEEKDDLVSRVLDSLYYVLGAELTLWYANTIQNTLLRNISLKNLSDLNSTQK